MSSWGEAIFLGTSMSPPFDVSRGTFAGPLRLEFLLVAGEGGGVLVEAAAEGAVLQLAAPLPAPVGFRAVADGVLRQAFRFRVAARADDVVPAAAAVDQVGDDVAVAAVLCR